MNGAHVDEAIRQLADVSMKCAVPGCAAKPVTEYQERNQRTGNIVIELYCARHPIGLDREMLQALDRQDVEMWQLTRA